MKKLFALLLIAGMAGFSACGPSEEEKEQMEKDAEAAVNELFDNIEAEAENAEESSEEMEEATEESAEDMEGEAMEGEEAAEEPQEMSEEE